MSGEGTVTITAENIPVESPPKGIEPGRYILLSISDQGIGIPPEVITKIFDPFFTTKSEGHGLGLAICFSIVKKHGGIIEVESQPGQGTTVQIYLPAAEETVISKPAPDQREHQGSGRILVMDDEPMVRLAIRAMLESFGYEVTEAEQGEEAIDIILQEDRAGNPFRAMFLDLTVPGGLGGKPVLEHLRKHGVTAPAFVFSGYSNDAVMIRPQEFGFAASLQKPFRRRDIEAVLNQHLALLDEPT